VDLKGEDKEEAEPSACRVPAAVDLKGEDKSI